MHPADLIAELQDREARLLMHDRWFPPLFDAERRNGKDPFWVIRPKRRRGKARPKRRKHYID